MSREAPGTSASVDIAELSMDGTRVLVLGFERIPAAVAAKLTPTEQDVVRLIADDLTTAAIAARRGTTNRTVSNQLTAIYRKLGIASRSELMWVLGRPIADDDG